MPQFRTARNGGYSVEVNGYEEGPPTSMINSESGTVRVVAGAEPATTSSDSRGRVAEGTRIARCIVALTVLVTAAACGQSSNVGSNPVAASPATTTAPTSDQTTPASTSTLGGDGMLIDTDRMWFAIDGVAGDLPKGWEDPHVRKTYVFLGYNTAAQPPEINWLSIADPAFIGIGPPGTPPRLEPATINVAATLREREVPLTELGAVTVDDIPVPIFQLDGYLQLCSTNTCRSNGPARFYALLPGADGDLIVEGESDLLSAPGAVTADEATPLIAALQTWADSVDLP